MNVLTCPQLFRFHLHWLLWVEEEGVGLKVWVFLEHFQDGIKP